MLEGDDDREGVTLLAAEESADAPPTGTGAETFGILPLEPAMFCNCWNADCPLASTENAMINIETGIITE
jgi:hypothetical protein